MSCPRVVVLCSTLLPVVFVTALLASAHAQPVPAEMVPVETIDDDGSDRQTFVSDGDAGLPMLASDGSPSADDPMSAPPVRPHHWNPWGFFALVGGNLSATLRPGQPGGGANLGLEASSGYSWDTGYWFGGYADLVRTLGADTTRISVGPEFGYLFFGLDGGYLVEWGEQIPRHDGINIRLSLGIGVCSFYIRSIWLFEVEPRLFVESGFVLKVPLHLIDPP